jgi:hypothetical protein
MGCDSAQGYFIGRPMPAFKLVQWADRNRDERVVSFDSLRLQRALRAAPVADVPDAAEGGDPE